MPDAIPREAARPSLLARWLRRHSLAVVAALGGAAGVAYAAGHAHRDAAPGALIGPAIGSQPGLAGGGGPIEITRDTQVDTVQIALLLDTSSSMDGLINQARSHLWNIVDQMGQMTRTVDGKARGVRIELALYEYGNTRLSPTNGYIRQVLPFTADLDKVSEQLHALVTTGGSEYAGQVIKTAVDDLGWSQDKDALKFVFLAGNEGFDQGPINAATAMKAAEAKGISVQLIYCGGQDESWSRASLLAGTDLTSIDQDRVAAHIAAPQDAEILRLGGQLNGTYMAYGADGAASMARQAAADASSGKMGAKVAIERSQMKAKKGYDNRSWDLIDALAADPNALAKADEGALPAELRGKSLEEQKQVVADKAAERARIQAEIAKLQLERNKFIEAEQAKSAPAAPSLETELMKGTRKVAGKKGWKL